MQSDLCNFAAEQFCVDETDERKLRYLYRKSGIDHKYSVVPDFSSATEKREFFPQSKNLEPFPGLEERMQLFNKHAVPLSIASINNCIDGLIKISEITHLITVTCTGLSAPGLDLLLMEALELPANITRTSVNFMGCYAAIHAMKLADAFCTSAKEKANVLVVCTELCTLHFQKTISEDNITSTLLFGDGSAALLVQKDRQQAGMCIQSFYSEVAVAGKNEMAWELSASGFLMTLTGLIPNLIKQDFEKLANNALAHAGLQKDEIDNWCMHPGGKKILDTLLTALSLHQKDFAEAYDTLRNYGNMSSPTIIFVLKQIFNKLKSAEKKSNIFGAAFGPGLTMETFLLSYDPA